MKTVNDWVTELASQLVSQGWLLGTSESCTGGLLSAALTDVAGSSNWFERGIVSYSNAAKQELLGVDPSLIEQYGAVSVPVAEAMAIGMLDRYPVQLAISITGIAGPGGGSEEKPVGTVCMAVGSHRNHGLQLHVDQYYFPGTRLEVRKKAVLKALQLLTKEASS